jgi:hypothetical protein
MKIIHIGTSNLDTMEKLKRYGSHYKIMCRDAPWDDRIEIPKNRTVDADSVIFDEIRTFASNLPSTSTREKWKVHIKNVFDRKGLIDGHVNFLAGNCSERIKLMDGEIVFGISKYPNIKLGTKVERKKEEKRTLELLSGNTNLLDTDKAQDTIKILGTHLLTLRDRIRDETVKNFPDATRSIEPDKYCANRYPSSFSYDYDLYLFGLQTMQREKGGRTEFLKISSLLKWLGLESLKAFTITCLLQGTDYNRGMKGIGKVRAKKIVKKGLKFCNYKIPESAKDEMINAYRYFIDKNEYS